MTLEDLFQELSVLSRYDRQRIELKLFDYDRNEDVPLPGLKVEWEGDPSPHLTIERPKAE